MDKDKKIYGYNLYGLKVNSYLKIPRYIQNEVYQQPDVTISIGKVEKPALNLEKTFYSPFTIANRDIFYQDIPSIAQYAIISNDQLIIDPFKKQPIKNITLFLIDSLLPVLLIKNGLYPVHASAIATEEGIHLFTSNRGDGKSSLAVKLCLEGFSFISDDICILKWDESDNCFISKCYYNYAYLWRSMIRPIFGRSVKGLKVHAIKQNLKKYAVSLDKYSDNEFRPVLGINHIHVNNQDCELSIRKVKGLEKIKASNQIIKSPYIAKVITNPNGIFKYGGLIAKNLDLTVITRNRLCKLNEFSTFIKNEILTRPAKKS